MIRKSYILEDEVYLMKHEKKTTKAKKTVKKAK